MPVLVKYEIQEEKKNNLLSFPSGMIGSFQDSCKYKNLTPFLHEKISFLHEQYLFQSTDILQNTSLAQTTADLCIHQKQDKQINISKVNEDIDFIEMPRDNVKMKSILMKLKSEEEWRPPRQQHY